jgi:hypothetical protein
MGEPPMPQVIDRYTEAGIALEGREGNLNGPMPFGGKRPSAGRGLTLEGGPMITRRNGALALGAMLLVSAALQAALIDITVSPNKVRYYPGEALVFSTTVRNRESHDITLRFDWDQAQYILDSTYFSETVFHWDETYNISIPANGSYTWHMRHDWRYYPVSLGAHSVVGRVIGHGDSSPVSFQVVEPVLPTKSFFLDFDEPLAIGSSYHFVEEYWPLGVHFRNATGHPVGVYEKNGNNYVTSNSTTYPTGFNVIADFDMPVYGATVDVSVGGNGNRVTMIAKDANGQVISSVTSPPVPSYNDFLGPLSIASDTPIASLEWWPSNVQAGVMIDNLHVIIPEPASTLSLTLGAALFFLRRSRRAT